MSEMGVEVVFALPHSIPLHGMSRVSLLGGKPSASVSAHRDARVRIRLIPSSLSDPYAGAIAVAGHDTVACHVAPEMLSIRATQALQHGGYAGDLLNNVHHYAEKCAEMLGDESFDVIHAHDWMTFPAGCAIAELTGKPLVVHVHSTEFDRSGEHPHPGISEIERVGIHAASAVICVSRMTKATVVARYGVPHGTTEVVYNGIATPDAMVPRSKKAVGDRIVLFLGRVTMQKGPEYFVAAAKKVLQKVNDVKFVIAGAGDMLHRMIEQVASLGIGHKVLFTGFLRGSEVDRAYERANLYVMPSVSEPFGIAPLEAIRHGVPVLLSRNSGVSEVIRHALKVDFWDIDEMANKIIGVLRYPPLGATLCEQAAKEIRGLTWHRAAAACVRVYEQV